MLIKKTRKIEVDNLELLNDDEIISFETSYNNTHTTYTFTVNQVGDYLDEISHYLEGTHRLYLWVEPEGVRKVPKEIKFPGKPPKTIMTEVPIDTNLQEITIEEKDPMEIFKPIPLNQVVNKTLRFIPFYYGNNIYLQRDGFHLLVGPTGSGKTYTAIKNLPTLERNYDIVLYVSLEVTDIDIKMRYIKSNKREPGDNLIIGQTVSVQQISDYVGSKHACIIVDNVDNLIRTGEGAYDTQLQFVMEFDAWAKRTGNTGIFLVQITKDFKDNLIVTDKKTQLTNINPDITFNSVAGVKQLATMSRTVLLTHYDFDRRIGYNKILKKGSALFESELNPDERKTFIR